MIYTPIIPTEKPKISFGAEIRTPSDSETDDHEQRSMSNEITEVEYPQARRICKKTQNPRRQNQRRHRDNKQESEEQPFLQ